jgi:hypothetical protein
MIEKIGINLLKGWKKKKNHRFFSYWDFKKVTLLAEVSIREQFKVSPCQTMMSVTTPLFKAQCC